MKEYKEKKIKEFEELLNSYKRGGEGENTIINKMRHLPNTDLEKELKYILTSTIDEILECLPPAKNRKPKGFQIEYKYQGFDECRLQFITNLKEIK